ncbi:hypothetical protein FB472_0327 [Rhodoglobus vestalii]|uniref:Uncharacterized protein n=1 Tax=Rhodoglobus vestalii TaxID=193384 RepID=A0A8H2PWY6_9MICO|nr:hypothetical protein [Rhodoglobus vestalii]TQO18804.1 hypothetical protein FB472_0327 [Rhodoglobus vestalii]
MTVDQNDSNPSVEDRDPMVPLPALSITEPETPRAALPLPASAHAAPGSGDNPIADWLDSLAAEPGEPANRSSVAPKPREL